MSDWRPTSGRAAVLIRRVWQAAAVATVSAMVATIGASPAHAEAWPINDGFENNPSSRWEPFYTGQAFTTYYFGTGRERSGLYAGAVGAIDGWATISRVVTLNGSTGYRTCGASIYGWALDANTTIDLEVIDEATWTYVSYRQAGVRYSATENYQLVDFANFPHTTARLVVRIGLQNSEGVNKRVLLDDFELWCTRPLS